MQTVTEMEAKSVPRSREMNTNSTPANFIHSKEGGMESMLGSRNTYTSCRRTSWIDTLKTAPTISSISVNSTQTSQTTD